jgi:A-factor type gamma-butyrolactone 1'-reductase (1S-forming)
VTCGFVRAREENRTPDLRITSALLCRLSYSGGTSHDSSGDQRSPSQWRAGADAVALRCDVTDEDSVRRAIDATVERFGRLDCAFNNAGGPGGQRLLHELDTDWFDLVIATNLRGPFVCMKHQIPAMLASGGGAIVNTSSVGGLVGSPTNSDYAASKWGLAGLVKCAALGYARENIRINAIAPGPTRSEMFDAWMPDDDARAVMADHFPMNYIADPDDMARAALFLLPTNHGGPPARSSPARAGVRQAETRRARC